MNILVIGGIAAGASVAAKAKRTKPQANVTIIEMENYVSFGACGLPYYLGGQFDDPKKMYARSPEKTQEAGINLLLKHKATEIDFDKKLVKVKNLETDEIKELYYDKLAICTGASPNVFGQGSDSTNVYTLTKQEDVDKLKEHLQEEGPIAVIGAGFIGLEVAEQLAEMGKKVILIHRSDKVLANIFDQEIGEKLVEAGKDKGIKFLMNHSYDGFVTEGDKAIKVITDKGEIDMSAAVLALGFKPNTKFITGDIEKLENGAIIIDRTGKTSVKDVYACGDCASIYHKLKGQETHIALATYANKMGRIIGSNIVQEEQMEYIGALGSASIKVGDLGAAAVGLNEEAAKDLGIDYSTSYIEAKNQTAYVKGQEDIYIKLIYRKDDRVLIGGQIAGKKGAVERASALAVAIHKEVTVDELGFMDFPYSPPFAPTWDPLNVAGNASK